MNFLGINELVIALNEKNTSLFKEKKLLETYENYSFCEFCNITYPINNEWTKII